MEVENEERCINMRFFIYIYATSSTINHTTVLTDVLYMLLMLAVGCVSVFVHVCDMWVH